MKSILTTFVAMTTLFAAAQNSDYPITVVPFTEVKLTDNFWMPRIQTNHKVTIPASFERCENTGRVKNFVMAANKSGKFCTVFPFDDTDIYKTLEGASYSLAIFPDAALDRYMDSLITIVKSAQEPDGYLYTARTIDPASPHAWAGNERWIKERELSHELYNSGHLFEAAAAHFQATGKKSLLDIALKNADLVCKVFGPGKRHVAPGHQVVEMGLVKLYRITGKKEYLETARFFVNERGRYQGYDSSSRDPWKNGAYWQDHKPVVKQDEAVGHAVRAGYLYAAVADIAALTGDTSLLNAVDKIWNNVVSKKFYVQGGIGAVAGGERFGDNYELPNSTAYNETCAAISNVYWNHRMFLLHGDARYIDVLERSLYNGLISGIGLDGKSFFYTNAMQVTNASSHRSLERERSGWFECSCCPTNLTRLIPSIPGYMYAKAHDTVYVNLYAAGKATLAVNGKSVIIEQQHNYPWEGNLRFTVSPKRSSSFALLFRIPGWANNEAVPSDLYKFADTLKENVTITVNGKPVKYTMSKGFAVVERQWNKNDVVMLTLPMEIRKIISSEKLENNAGKVALQRGPLVYCAEWADNGGRISNIVLPSVAKLETEHKEELLNGVTVIKGMVPAVKVHESGLSAETITQPFMAIPYYAWANRGKGEMMVWLPEKIDELVLISKNEK